MYRCATAIARTARVAGLRSSLSATSRWSLPLAHRTNISSTIRRTLFASNPATPEYSSLEYPLAKEAPEITKTRADQVRGQAPRTTKAYQPPPTTTYHDTDAVSAEWIQQKQAQPLSAGVSAIAPTRPSEIPPNVPAEELQAPETMVTRLDNGARVVRWVNRYMNVIEYRS